MSYYSSEAALPASAAIRLVMFAVALNGDRARRRLRQLGVTDAELAEFFSGSEHNLAEARQFNVVAALMTRERLGALLRARIAEVALTATKGSELSALARALERLPDWAIDGAEDEYWDTAQRDPQPARAAEATPARPTESELEETERAQDEAPATATPDPVAAGPRPADLERVDDQGSGTPGYRAPVGRATGTAAGPGAGTAAGPGCRPQISTATAGRSTPDLPGPPLTTDH